MPLSYYGAFTRGIATGANSFFSLSLSKYKELNLPRSTLKYCITKSSQVRSNLLTINDIKQMEKNDSYIFILDVNKKTYNEAVKKYILYGEEKKFHLRYLTSKRTPWYTIEKRQPAPILFGVFSRNAFKIIRNYSSALNLTCYHGFYPNIFGQAFIDRLFLIFSFKSLLYGFAKKHQNLRG